MNILEEQKMKLIEIVNKIDVKKINVKKDEFHKLEDIQILRNRKNC